MEQGNTSDMSARSNPSINTDAGDKAAGGYVKRWAFIQTMVNGVKVNGVRLDLTYHFTFY
ncbi:MAG: hypothetical protein DID91_2727703740 [Candidatus Nitrotoga sp. MKT]|nr:MAG: hypothetical protein DID91_2727703740 [Candidatus Nitrotoga sp. MKT]